MEQNIAEHFQANVLAAQADGNTVTARAELRSDVFRARGAERVISSFTLGVRDGKIMLWSPSLDTTDPQTAAYRAAVQAEAVPAQPAPSQLPRALPRTRDMAAALPVLAGAAGLVVAIGVAVRRRSRRPSGVHPSETSEARPVGHRSSRVRDTGRAAGLR